VRPIGDCLYLMPPLSTPPARIAEAAATLLSLLSGTLPDLYAGSPSGEAGD
jgi:adenosylmethionine-8-amino-7-oxononanoate aminotransferase